MRVTSGTDFSVQVEGLGNFRFGRRTPRDVYRIRALYNELTDGYEDKNGQLDVGAFAFATLKVMMVSGPNGFDLDKLDPVMDEAWEDRVLEIFKALREQELLFRPRSGSAVQGEGKAAVDNVSAEVS